MTSSEAVAYLREHAHARVLAPVVRELAAAADQVKFALGVGQAEEAARHLAAARQLVSTLEAALRPPSAERDPAPNGVRFPQRSLSSAAEAGFTPAEAHDQARAERGRQ
jgi:hypothetical protein